MKWGFRSKQEPFENLEPDDTIIVVIGPSGAGKSLFINTAVDERLKVLLPSTKEFAYVRCTLENSHKVVFVDTRAYNDYDNGSEIREWLRKASIEKHLKVTGFLYLTQNYFELDRPRYEIFKKSCGNLYPENEMLVLTKCGIFFLATSQYNREILTTLWKKKMGEKAEVCFHYGTMKSAWDVVTALVGMEAGIPNIITEFYRKEKLRVDIQSFHSTTLSKTAYSALTTFEPGISPWIHPSQWLDANTKHIRSIFDDIVEFAGTTFPATTIFQRLILYIFTYTMLCSGDKSLWDKLNATLKKCQNRDMLSLMRNQGNIKNELLNLFRNASPEHLKMQFEDLLKKLLVLDSIALSATIELLVADEDTWEELVETRGAGAQSLVNLLHARLDFPMDSAHKRLLVRALTHLSERSGLYPDSLTLTDVTPERGRRATGGFADVYKAICLGEDVALKVFKIPLPAGVDSLNTWRSSDDRFQNLLCEFMTWRQLSHPSVLPFYGIHFLEDPLEIRFCLVSPWMENGNIVEFLGHRNRIAPDTDTTDCVSLALDIALGVQYLHGEKVIHRDLKGPNILISPSMRACIADFGLATLSDSGSATTLSGSAIMGTPRWLAPELIPHEEAKRRHTFASDIYAFALVCYEMFSGTVPFEDMPMYGFIPLLQRGERPSLPATDLSRRRGLSHEMKDLIRDCWDQEPTNRPSADEVVERLQLLQLVDRRPPNEIGTSFFTQLLSNQVDNPFAILSREYHGSALRA